MTLKPKKPKWEIVDPPEPHEFSEMDDTGYCKECGGIEAVHEPYLTQIFDWMRRIP